MTEVASHTKRIGTWQSRAAGSRKAKDTTLFGPARPVYASLPTRTGSQVFVGLSLLELLL